MSDNSVSIVPRQSTYPHKEKKAKEILDWLISLDIIKPTISDCILGFEGGYAFSDGARQIVNDTDDFPFRLTTDGLEIINERQVFDTGGNGIEQLICPNCQQNISDEDWSFLDEWSKGKSDNITCPLCNSATNIHKYKFDPAWGFSDLGFKFWNLTDLTEDFITQFKQKLACEVSVVHQHI